MPQPRPRASRLIFDCRFWHRIFFRLLGTATLLLAGWGYYVGRDHFFLFLIASVFCFNCGGDLKWVAVHRAIRAWERVRLGKGRGSKELTDE